MTLLVSPHTHCESKLTGSPLSSMIKKAVDLGRTHFSYTDLGHLSSYLKAYGQAKDANLKFAGGIEFYFKDTFCPIVVGTKADRCNYFNASIFAKTQDSYQEIVRVVSSNDMPKIKIREDFESLWSWKDLERLSKFDTLLVLGGPHCMVGKALLADSPELAEKILLKLHGLFGDRISMALTCEPWAKKYATVLKIKYKDGTSDSILSSDLVTTNKARKIKASDLANRNGHFLVKSKIVGNTFYEVEKEISSVTEHKGFLPLPVDVTLTINKFFVDMSKKHGITLLASDYAFYSDKEDHIVQTMVLEGANKLKANLHMKSGEEFQEYLIKKLGLTEEQSTQILNNNNEWAKNFDSFELNYKWRLADGGENPAKKCIDIIKKKGLMKWDNPMWVARLKEEMGVFSKNGIFDLTPYFLPIHDVIDFYEEKGFLTGPGRGSAAGSLTCYLMGITKVNPFTYGLSFNRFYSKERIQALKLADIDSDLESRDLLVGEDGMSGYLYNRWGNKAAQISTRTKIRLKSAIKDTNRYINGSVEKSIEVFTKSLPDAGQGITDEQFIFGMQDDDGNHIDGLIETSEPLQKYSTDRPKEWAIVRQALGITRAFSRHACISGETLVDNNGTVKKFKDSNFSLEKPISVWSSGVKDTVFVSFNNGISIKCTPDHKFITTEGEVEAKDLLTKTVDYKEFSNVSGNNVMDRNLLFALGWALNDGTFNIERTNQSFHFTPKKDDFAKHKVLSYITSINVNIWEDKERQDQWFCGSKNLPKEFFESQRNRFQRLPDYFWALTYECQCIFMNGFMSANGYVLNTKKRVGFKISSRLLASDICVWMNANKIKTSAIYLKPNIFFIRGKECCNHGSVEVAISGFESREKFKLDIGFCQEYKAKRLEEITAKKHKKDNHSQRIRPVKCLSIVESNREEVFDFNEPLENIGYINGILVHNCAFVIADKPISEIVPIKDGNIVQYEATEAEKAGLIKYDFLVINQLKDIRVCLDLINKKNKEKHKTGYFTHNGKPTYIWDLPTDLEAYKSVWDGNTESCFQINTASMIPFVKGIKPKDIEDLSIILSLVRPGPLDYIDQETGRSMAEEYIHRRDGGEYKDVEILKELIPETHSVLVYQEQVTKIAKQLAGFTGAAAENLREAIGKKKRSTILKIKPDFIAGCLKSNKITEDEAQTLWDRIVTFGRYAFNKSHGVSYAFITYACIFLKHYYPLEFWAAVLTNAKEKEISGKLWPYVKHLVAAPDINLSTDEMEIDYANGKIRAKLGVIKGMAAATIDPIVAGRPYKDIKDFVEKEVAGDSVTRKLIHVGVLDSLFPPKLGLLEKMQIFEDLLEANKFNKKVAKAQAEGKKIRIEEPKKGEIKAEYLDIEKNPLKNAAVQKSILPSLLVGLRNLGMNYSTLMDRKTAFKKAVMTKQGRFKRRDDPNARLDFEGGGQVVLLSGEEFEIIDKRTPEESFKDIEFAVFGYVVSTSIFDYSNNTKQALKVNIDVDGYVKEHVMWPNYFSKKLEYPKDLKKGNICMFFMKKRQGSGDPAVIEEIVIEA